MNVCMSSTVSLPYILGFGGEECRDITYSERFRCTMLYTINYYLVHSDLISSGDGDNGGPVLFSS